MTGKELIMYILENNLENEPVFQHGKFIGFVTAGEVAERLNVGVATVYVWVYQKRLNGVWAGGTLYIPADFELKDVD